MKRTELLKALQAIIAGDMREPESIRPTLLLAHEWCHARKEEYFAVHAALEEASQQFTQGWPAEDDQWPEL